VHIILKNLYEEQRKTSTENITTVWIKSKISDIFEEKKIKNVEYFRYMADIFDSYV